MNLRFLSANVSKVANFLYLNRLLILRGVDHSTLSPLYVVFSIQLFAVGCHLRRYSNARRMKILNGGLLVRQSGFEPPTSRLKGASSKTAELLAHILETADGLEPSTQGFAGLRLTI